MFDHWTQFAVFTDTGNRPAIWGSRPRYWSCVRDGSVSGVASGSLYGAANGKKPRRGSPYTSVPHCSK